MRRLFPGDAIDLDADELYAAERGAHGDGRPWLLVNMVASLDGATTVAGRSGGLGNQSDRAVFQLLRSYADVVLVGAGTVRAEGYGPPKRPDLRVAVVSARLNLDFDAPLWQSGRGIVITTETAGAVPDGVAAVRAGRNAVDLDAAIRGLDASVVLCEGGPSLNGALLAADVIDEWCMTLSPRLVGGEAARVIHGPALDSTAPLRLGHIAVDEEGFLFLRYLREAELHAD